MNMKCITVYRKSTQLQNSDIILTSTRHTIDKTLVVYILMTPTATLSTHSQSLNLFTPKVRFQINFNAMLLVFVLMYY